MADVAGVADGSFWLAVKELGLAGLVLGGVYRFATSWLIPAWERQANAREVALAKANEDREATHREQHAFVVAMFDRMMAAEEARRVESREQTQEITKSLDRLCALIVAHDMRSSGGRPSELINAASNISGHDFSGINTPSEFLDERGAKR